MSVASVGYNSVSPIPLPADFRGQTVVRQNDEAPQSESKVKPQAIRSTAADLERISSSSFNKKLQFVVDHTSNEVIVKVIDRSTDKVIRELPPEELQRLHENLKEAIGLLFDEMV
jgi:flagellar protein FlaG